MQNQMGRKAPLMAHNPITLYYNMKPNSKAVVSNEVADDSNAVAALNAIMHMLYELDPNMVFMLSAVNKPLHYSIYERYGKQIFPSLYTYHKNALLSKVESYIDASVEEFRLKNNINDEYIDAKTWRNIYIFEAFSFSCMVLGWSLMIWQKSLPLDERSSSLLLMTYASMAIALAGQPLVFAYFAVSRYSKRMLERLDSQFVTELYDKLNANLAALPEELFTNGAESEPEAIFGALINTMEGLFSEVVPPRDVAYDDVEAQQGSLSDEETPLLRMSRR